jgi:hypothetical protein
VDWAELQAAGVYDPNASNAVERRELLEFLCERGATIDDLVFAAELGALPTLAGELYRRGRRPRRSAAEVAEATGIPLGLMAQIARAAGLPVSDPDDPILRDEDVDTFRTFQAGAAMFGEDSTLEFTRTMGTGLAAIADAAMAMFGLNVAGPLVDAHATELERAKASEMASILLTEEAPKAIYGLFLHHVEVTARRELAAGGAFRTTSTRRFVSSRAARTRSSWVMAVAS